MLRTTLIALKGYRGKNTDNKYEKTLSEVSYNLIPAHTKELSRCVYILLLIVDISYLIFVAMDYFRYLCIDRALPIASLDLIYCISKIQFLKKSKMQFLFSTEYSIHIELLISDDFINNH